MARFKNPLRGAVLVTNGKRRGVRRRNAGAKRSVDLKKIVARLKNGRRGSKRRNPLAFRANPKRRNLKRKNPLAFRKNSRKANRRRAKRRNPLAFRANPKRRRGSKRRNPLAFRRNGLALRNPRHRKHNRRRNGLALRNNPMGGIFGTAQSKISGIIGMVPLVGKPIAKYALPLAVPAAAAALIIGATHFALQFASPFIPAVAVPFVQPIGYTVGGAALGLLVQLVPSKLLSPASKKAIAGLAVIGGGAVDGIRYLTKDEAAAPAVAGFGEGMYWKTVSDSDGLAVQSMYRDASPLDAAHCPADLDAAEGEAALSGPQAWAARFQPARRITGNVTGGPSRHAGQHGGRWGWLIGKVGYSGFASLVSRSPSARQSAIAKHKAEALRVSSGAYGALVFAQ